MKRVYSGAALAAVLAFWAGSAVAQVQFSIAETESCLAASEAPVRAQCIGKSARACMNGSGEGATTYGMILCLSEEHDYWDARLNNAYGALRTANAATDSEMKEIGSVAPEQAPALRDLQRAWIAYRDATCAYETGWWGGGSGGGPAGVDCTMRLTAQQTLYLEDALTWGN